MDPRNPIPHPIDNLYFDIIYFVRKILQGKFNNKSVKDYYMYLFLKNPESQVMLNNRLRKYPVVVAQPWEVGPDIE